MARQSQPNLGKAPQAPFMSRDGFPPVPDADWSNGYTQFAVDASNLGKIPLIGVDSANLTEVGGSAISPLLAPIQYQSVPIATIPTAQSFYIAREAITLLGVKYTHATAGTDAAAVTCYVTKDTGTQAPGAGTTVMVGTFNCKGTINVTQVGTLLAASSATGDFNSGIVLAAGDRLSVVFTGTTTALAGVAIELVAMPGVKLPSARYYVASVTRMPASAAAWFAIANRPMQVVGGYVTWSTKASIATTIDIVKDTGTTAAGAGTSILSATVSAAGTANTVNTFALSATAATLLMNAGDRLSVKLSSAATALAGLTIVIYFAPVFSDVLVNWNCFDAASSAVTQTVFGPADRDYEIADGSAIWGVASTSGVVDITIDRGTNAPGAGTTALASTVDGSTTAATTNVLALATARRNRIVGTGDRIAVKTSGTKTSWADLAVSLNLIAR